MSLKRIYLVTFFSLLASNSIAEPLFDSIWVNVRGGMGSGYAHAVSLQRGNWGFDCEEDEQLILGSNQHCDKRDLNDVALVYGVEAVFGRFWGLGVSADYAVIQGETLLMGGLSIPIRVLSH